MMDTAFFWSSKLAWLVLSPDSLLLLLLVATWLLLLRGRERTGRILLGVTVSLCLLVALLPLGEWLVGPLERRFEAPPLPERLDGIIVLGGSIDPVASAHWNQPQINEAGERLMAFAALGRRYPQARLVFTGGSGSPLSQSMRESDFIAAWAADQGIDMKRLVIEGESRNTWENLQYSQSMLRPRQEEQWLLITSAFHMPRAMGVAEKLDWQLTPWPVDYRGTPEPVLQLKFQFARHLDTLRVATREWLGLLAYRLSGRL